MPLIQADRVCETSTTTGTGTLTLAGAKTGFQSFSAVGDANTCFYAIAHQTLSEWEVGIGTYTASGTTLARTTVLASSNAGAAVNLSAGTKDVFVCDPAGYGQPFLYKHTTSPGVGAANETLLSSTAGNARGKGAVDLQLSRNGATKVASGNYAFAAGMRNTASGTGSVAIGQNCTASGSYSIAMGGNGSTASGSPSLAMMKATASAGFAVAIGYYATASGTNSVALGRSLTASAQSAIALGYRANADVQGKLAHAAGRFAADGDAQICQYVMRLSTSNGSQTEMVLPARLVIPNDTTWAFSILLVARRTDADNESAGYTIDGVIDRQTNAASTALVGTVTYTVLGEDNAGWDVAVDADTTNGALRIQVTGQGSKTIRWVAFVHTAEVTG